MALPARIPRVPLDHQRRPDPAKAPRHRIWIKLLVCAVCGAPHPDPHHLRGTFLDGRPTGIGRRDDRYQIPLCRRCHDATHDDGDLEGWLMRHGIDGRALAAALWRVSGDMEAGLRIVSRARKVEAR